MNPGRAKWVLRDPKTSTWVSWKTPSPLTSTKNGLSSTWLPRRVHLPSRKDQNLRRVKYRFMIRRTYSTPPSLTRLTWHKSLSLFSRWSIRRALLDLKRNRQRGGLENKMLLVRNRRVCPTTPMQVRKVLKTIIWTLKYPDCMFLATRLWPR